MQIINIAKKLESVGLTEKQAKVYVAALFLGPSAVQRISEQSDVNRATTYVILSELAEMGLVSESSEGKKTLYVAESPEAIDRYLSGFEKEIAERKSKLKDTIKDLRQISRVEVAEAPIVRFYKGPEATESVLAYLRRKSKPNEIVYAMSDIDEVIKVFPDVLTTGPKSRIKKNIASRLFYSGKIDLKNDPKSKRETIKLKDNVVADLNIYHDRVTILSYRGEESSGVIIESKEIVAVLRQLFELAWDKQSKRK